METTTSTEPVAVAAGLLTETQRSFWRRHGWLVIEDLLPPPERAALAGWVAEIATPVAAEGARRLHYFEQTDAGRTLCRTERFIEDSAALDALINRGALRATAGALLGEPAVLYKEKVNYKQAGGAGFAPHQDATAYAFVRKHVTCLVAVDAMSADNGGIEFSPFDRDELLRGDGDGCIDRALAATLPWVRPEVPAGSAVFFTSYVPHRSGPNRSATSRRALYLTYNAASEGDRRAAYYSDRDRSIEAALAAGGASARVSTIGHFEGRAAL